ncbi:MAG: histidine phosphatase family protein [bacterium]|nr:histidine phosphatase family protein [bacterium]
MLTHIYLIRHGKVFNPTNVFYGRKPRMYLSEEGRRGIEKTANFLKERSICSIYTSPLLRARQTGTIIQTKLSTKTTKHISKALIDIKTSLEGKPFSYIQSIRADFYSPQFRDVNDETIEQIKNRIFASIKEIAKKNEGKEVVVISHGDPIMIAKAYIENKPLTLDSIRPGKDMYVQYGEIQDIIISSTGTFTINKIFSPKHD